METSDSTNNEGISHTNLEIANVYRCSRIEREWLHDASMPANYAVTLLHATLFNGVEQYTKKGLIPNRPGDYRKEDVKVGKEPDNFYVRGTDVQFLMRDYADRLGQILRSLPTAPSGHVAEIIGHAAWAYYTLIRIHPFLDGNGRVSRMVMQRVLKGAGFKDIIFSAENGRSTKKYADDKEKHLAVMKQVDNTGSLAPLEKYIAERLLARYQGSPNRDLQEELRTFIETERSEAKNQHRRLPISNIWPQFGNIDLAGNFEEHPGQ